MDFTAERLAAVLKDRPFQFYPQIGSTNDLALEWLREGKPTGAVIIADEQTKGRGRLGRSWFSPPGLALMFSMLLRPPVDYLSRVNMLGAVSVYDVLRALGADDVRLKWPNDVLLNGRKVCGILAEAAWDGDKLLGAVLGIGVNVRVDFEGTPFQDTATSIEAVIGTVNRLDVLARLLARLDFWAARLESAALFDVWRSRLFMLGRHIAVTSVGGNVEGFAEDVDPDGALLLRDSAGMLHRVMAGDISLG